MLVYCHTPLTNIPISPSSTIHCFTAFSLWIKLISYTVKLNIIINMLLFSFCRYSNGSWQCDDYSLYSCLDSISTWFASQDKCLPCRYNKLVPLRPAVLAAVLLEYQCVSTTALQCAALVWWMECPVWVKHVLLLSQKVGHINCTKLSRYNIPKHTCCEFTQI